MKADKELNENNLVDSINQIYGWNQTYSPYPKDKTAIELFEEQVLCTPDNVATTFEGTSLTYSQVNEEANKFGHYIKDHFNINPDDMIVLCLERSHHMLIAILGVLKAGASYVPVGPEYPDDRISYILSDTHSKVVITNAMMRDRFLSLSSDIPVISVEDGLLWKDCVCTNPIHSSLPNNLVYVIYTSGTTGTPKGVMLENHSLVNRITWMNSQYPLKPDDRILQKTTYTFDVSVWEFFWPILYGASIVFAKPEGHKDSAYLAELIHRERVSILHFVPSMLTAFEETIANNPPLQNSCASLRYMFCSGEALGLKQVQLCHKLFPGLQIHNLYGPTETCVDVLYYDCNASNISKVLIGRPIFNTSAYILDENLNPLPIGATGELYIGGDGVARGYLNKPELTKEKFINNPYQSAEEIALGINDRLYKTGDLARYLPDGNIDYLGRNDSQVKIRGFRIELGEIESVLNTVPGISQSVVLAKENNKGTKYLVGYYASRESITEDLLIQTLKKSVPEYMVPSFFIHMECLPVTNNGKLDRKSLPEPEFIDKNTYVAPENNLQESLCQIYADVLGLDVHQVGINDDFFKLGGDSITCIQLINRIRIEYNLTVNINNIFSFKTVKQLSLFIESETAVLTQVIAEQGVLDGEVPLLPIQEWFFKLVDDGLMPAYNHMNQSFLIDAPVLDVDILIRCVAKLSEYHDSLRLTYSFDKSRGVYIQSYRMSMPDIDICTIDVNSLSEPDNLSAVLTQWQSSFNIFEGQMFKVGYVYGYSDGSAKVYFALHHLIVDSVSWRILKDHLEILYKHYEHSGINDTTSVNDILGEKSSSYRQWSQRINHDYVDLYPQEIEYWKEQTEDLSAVNSILVQKSAEEQVVESISFDEETTESLLREVNGVYNTSINDLLLTALSLTLKEYTGSVTNYVLLEGHGRENIWDDLDTTKTVGWFTSMYPVKLSSKEDGLGNNVVSVKESLRGIPNNGIGYGAALGYVNYELPLVSFNYLGHFDGLDGKKEWRITSSKGIVDISPLNRFGGILSLNGAIFNKRLQFSLHAYLSAEDTKLLMVSFEKNLKAVIDFLSMQKRSYLTLSDIDNIITSEYLDRLQSEREVENVFMANSLQQGFIYHAVNQGEYDDAYRVQIVWDYLTHIDVQSMKLAWQYAQCKYEVLRLRLAWEEELVQVIDKDGVLNWNYEDISEKSNAEKENYIRDLIDRDRKIGFDLSCSPLFRIYLLKLEEKQFTCLLSCHHIIIDGWSNSILLNYIHNTYQSIINSNINIDRDVTYGTSQKYLQRNLDNDTNYWRDQLDKEEVKEDLTFLVKQQIRHNINLSEYKRVEVPKEHMIVFDDYLTIQIESYCLKNGFTINALIQYCWHKLLSVYSNSKTTILGVVTAGRNMPIARIEEAVGLYINTLPVILAHSNQPIVDQITQLQNLINEVNSRSNINLASLNNSGHRLFSSLFVYENYPVSSNESNLDIRLRETKEKLDYPLCVVVWQQGTEISISVKYASEILDEDIVCQASDGIKHLVKKIVCDSIMNTKELSYLPSEQYNQIISEWNKTCSYYSKTQTIIDLFEEQVDKTPNNIAITFKNRNLTYTELNQASDKVGHFLKRKFNTSHDDLIALFIDRSEFMPIAILGVLKSGAAYVPISLEHPDEMITYIISDTCPKCILSSPECIDQLQKCQKNSVPIIAIDDKELWDEYVPPYFTKETKFSDLAYVIYTSGTTGKPKGVMIEHRGLVNLALGLAKEFEINNINKYINYLWYSNYVFDAHVMDLFPYIICGHTVHIASDDIRYNLNALNDYIVKNEIHSALIPPTLLSTDILLDMNNLIVGGDITNIEIMKKYFKLGKAVTNAYGPTEITVCASTHLFQGVDSNKNIGRPIMNTTFYILDDNCHPVPIGAIGELYIGGDGIARGYLNQPELTNERFIKNPFQTEQEISENYNSYIYKSGDLVRYLPSGDIEYIGRADSQVKIRGFRIELEEIESCIMTIDIIDNVKVLVLEENNMKYIVAYYVSRVPLDCDWLIREASRKLPKYMVPSFFIHLEKLPITINGKLDRKKLPVLQICHRNLYVAPESEEQEKISCMYAEVLNINSTSIGIDDDFFKLGGNSILAIRLISKINKEFGKHLNVNTLFNNKTVRAIAIKVLEDSQFTPIVEFNHSGTVNLFMLHPGGGDCHIYDDMAKQLSTHYNCYGIDNYNLYHDEKILNLNRLADYYLNAILEVQSLDKDQVYNLLGWSLGGQISLEIAVALESRGVKNINIILLDSILGYDDFVLQTLRNNVARNIEFSGMAKELLTSDESLFTQSISGHLKYSKIYLFKAKEMDEIFDEALKQHISNLKYNNVERVVSNYSNITLIDLYSSTHSSILRDPLILDFLINTKKAFK